MLPLAKNEEIKRRHDAVELLVRQESTSEVIEIRSRLGDLGGLPQLCFQVNMGVASVHIWFKLLKVIHVTERAPSRYDDRTDARYLVYLPDMQCYSENPYGAQHAGPDDVRTPKGG